TFAFPSAVNGGSRGQIELISERPGPLLIQVHTPVKSGFSSAPTAAQDRSSRPSAPTSARSRRFRIGAVLKAAPFMAFLLAQDANEITLREPPAATKLPGVLQHAGTPAFRRPGTSGKPGSPFLPCRRSAARSCAA